MTWQTTTSLFPWQQRGVDKVKRSRVGALFMDPGTGKTRTAIELAHLRREQISRVVWFCPVSLMETVRYEILKHTDCTSEQVCVFGNRTTQRTLPAALWYVVGIESMGQSDRVTLAVHSLIDERTMAIVDESTYIKGHRAKRTLRITRLCDKARYRLILTGTPITQGVVDLYAQMRFLSPKILGYNSFYSFAANHLEYSEDYPGMIVRSHNTDWLAAKINPYVYQVTKSECMDLPPKLHDSLYFGMTLTQSEWYLSAKEEILLSTPDEELLENYTIFRLFTALQQIICGFWNRYPDPPPHPGPRSRHWSPEDWQQWEIAHPHDRTPELITMSHVRLDMLVRAINGSGAERIIIWANHQQSIADIDSRLTHEFGAGCVAHFHGAIPAREREAQLERWRRSARFLVMTQASGGHGLTLNEATHHIFYSNGFKFSERLQAEDRSHRIGQTKPVTYTDIVCTSSIDERIQKALNSKGNAFNDFRREVERFKDGSREEVRKLLMSI